MHFQIAEILQILQLFCYSKTTGDEIKNMHTYTHVHLRIKIIKLGVTDNKEYDKVC